MGKAFIFICIKVYFQGILYMCAVTGTSKTGFGQVKIMKEFA
jgi:hypothetical protein